jgi:hypothetical protein
MKATLDQEAFMNHPFAPFVVAAAALVPTTPAVADWVGLGDGQYQVTLSCIQSVTLDCSQTFVGTITVQGAGIDQLDVTIDSLDFAGDPGENITGDQNGSSEGSIISHPVGAAMALRQVTAGTLFGYGTGERFWAYCSDLPNSQSCLADTLGTWTAARIGTVAEPSALAAALLGLGLAAATGQTRRRPRTAAS